jgi:hypothetical protein
MNGEVLFTVTILLIVAAFLATSAAIYWGNENAPCACQEFYEPYPTSTAALPDTAFHLRANTDDFLGTSSSRPSFRRHLVNTQSFLLVEEDPPSRNPPQALRCREDGVIVRVPRQESESSTKKQPYIQIEISDKHGVQLVLEKSTLTKNGRGRPHAHHKIFLYGLNNMYGVRRAPVDKTFWELVT